MAAYKRNMGGEERNRRFKGWRLFFFLLGFFGTIWFSIPLLWNVRNIGGILGLLFSVCLMAGSCFLPRIAAHFSLKARKTGPVCFWGLYDPSVFLGGGAFRLHGVWGVQQPKGGYGIHGGHSGKQGKRHISQRRSLAAHSGRGGISERRTQRRRP